jgi:pimeloyl-ACP methyl ester carboxylesterase
MARIVLIHGAFCRASVWDSLLPRLRAAGHEVEAMDLPGQGADRTPVEDMTLEGYARRICETLAQGTPAVVVGHSMGGVAVTQAAARCPEHVAALVYVSAFVPQEGQSLTDLVALPEAAGDQVQANLLVTGDPPVARLPAEGARIALFNCCTEEQAARGLEQLGPQPVVVFDQPLTLDGADRDAFEQLPRAYILCTRDRAIPPALQRRMLGAAGCEPVIELDTDHSPWLSRAEELLAALERIMQTVAAAAV